jgi:hypothetical protein
MWKEETLDGVRKHLAIPFLHLLLKVLLSLRCEHPLVSCRLCILVDLQRHGSYTWWLARSSLRTGACALSLLHVDLTLNACVLHTKPQHHSCTRSISNIAGVNSRWMYTQLENTWPWIQLSCLILTKQHDMPCPQSWTRFLLITTPLLSLIPGPQDR